MKIAIILLVFAIALILVKILLFPSGSTGKSVTTRKRAKVSSPSIAATKTASRYHSVSIKCGEGACEQALALENRRFLAGKLGKLPLDGCTSSNCSCKFVHRDDRRDHEDDKRAPAGLRSELYAASGKPERRVRTGRRKSDFE